MRKWTYLVAALLVGGATTTFTGCIDNDEPAGIEQLRGAKAEFIKAKAAYVLQMFLGKWKSHTRMAQSSEKFR